MPIVTCRPKFNVQKSPHHSAQYLVIGVESVVHKTCDDASFANRLITQKYELPETVSERVIMTKQRALYLDRGIGPDAAGRLKKQQSQSSSKIRKVVRSMCGCKLKAESECNVHLSAHYLIFS